jgi:demethylmenaquinone methyltransferase / 2-methoxy-6-polyprenyl-1,4-benzoquinol methylase
MKPYDKNEPETIQAMFASIANNYDKTNAVLSFQMHRIWNASFIRKVIAPVQPETLLDLCCGTGDIAFNYLRQIHSKRKVYMLDFCEEILICAKEKAQRMKLQHHDVDYLKADAQAIPLPNNCISCATIAYGIRNIKVPSQCISDVYRVLKPGGTFGILELTRPNNGVLRAAHQFYLRTFMPLMGKLLTSNQEAYEYLCNSINTFIPPTQLQHLMQENGFHNIQCQPLFGGIATILSGKKG